MASRRPASKLDEFGLIDRYFRPLASHPGALGLTDDVALLKPVAGKDLVVTTDMVSEGVHFLSDDPPASIARKVLRVNLSDLAAKGAEPFGYLTSLALPAVGAEEWVRQFARGLKGDQNTYGVALLGGDTIRTRKAGVSVSITGFGRVATGRAVLRSTARPGDALYVSGTIGDAALGLLVRKGRISADEVGHGVGRLLDRYLHPRPRVRLAPVVLRHARAAIDVSDGLLADLRHICRASRVSGEIRAASLPLSRPAARLVKADRNRIKTVVAGGDDYEILAAVAEQAAADFESEAADAGVQVTRIGRVISGISDPWVLMADGERLSDPPSGHLHF